MEIDEFEQQARLDGVDVDAMVEYYERRGQLKLEFHELAITQIFADMSRLRLNNSKAYILIEFIITNPLLSLREIADIFTIPKTSLFRILDRAADTLPWFRRLLELKKLQRIGGPRGTAPISDQRYS